MEGDSSVKSGFTDPNPTSSFAIDSTAPPHFELMDVWSRSGSKYRIRAVSLLALNIVLFAGAACFTYWLRSGEFFAPIREGYWDSIAQAFVGVGRPDVSLAAFLIEPISIHDVPMQIPIVGLLMAALISIPILVAILYRFWSSIPFIAIIGFIAVMPWLAITLFFSCIIASVRPFRTRIRFMSAMLALIPAILYLILAWSGTRDVVVGRIDPVDRIKFVAPWVLAIVASAVVFAIVLSIARVVNYRPGAVTPLLAVMFAIPMLLFEKHVGRDELYYRLLERLDRAYFADENAGLGLHGAAEERWERLPQPRPPRGPIREMEQESWLFELASDLSRRQVELAANQSDIVRRCDWFHHQYPYSPYTPNALFIKARAEDLRLDIQEFRRTRWIRLYDDVPNPNSRQTWEIIAENRPDSPLASVALLRMSQLDAKECDIDRAIARTRQLLTHFDRNVVNEPNKGDEFALFLDRPALEAGLNIDGNKVVLAATWLRDLLEANSDDEAYRMGPLCGAQLGRAGTAYGLLDLDAREDDYENQLKKLLDAFPSCKLSDNIELELAKKIPAVEDRTAALSSLLQRYPEGDAAPEGMIRLAIALREQNEPQQAGLILARLLQDHPHSIWARKCAELRLQPTRIRVSAVLHE
jgi:hypothetical protein